MSGRRLHGPRASSSFSSPSHFASTAAASGEDRVAPNWPTTACRSGRIEGECRAVLARRPHDDARPPSEGQELLLLRPSDAGCRRFSSYDLAGSWPGEHVLGTVPLGRHHEQTLPVRASERTGEAATVE